MALNPFEPVDLDRRITFQRKVAAAGFMSAGQEGWQNVATVWAQVQEQIPSRAERLAEGLVIARRPARIRIYYRDDLTADMRVLYRDRVLQLMAPPIELGHRFGLEMMAQDFSTGGGAA